MPNSEDDAKDKLDTDFEEISHKIKSSLKYAEEHRIPYYFNDLFVEKVQPILKGAGIDCEVELQLKDPDTTYHNQTPKRKTPKQQLNMNFEPPLAPRKRHRTIKYNGGGRRTRRLNRRR
jgi:hypothetical protein